MVDVAVVGYGQMPSVRSTEITETQMVLEVTKQAIAMAGVDRHDIGFTVSGSCDYIAGQTFAFVHVTIALKPRAIKFFTNSEVSRNHTGYKPRRLCLPRKSSRYCFTSSRNRSPNTMESIEG